MKQTTPPSADVFDWAGLVQAPELLDRFAPVEILGGLSRERFFEALNEDRGLPQATFKHRPEGLLRSALRSRSTFVSVGAQLRMYVDEWLDTGVGSHGVEVPGARDLTKAPNACAAVFRFAGNQRLRLEPAPSGLILEFPSESRGSLRALGESPIGVADRIFSLFLLCGWRARLAKCRRAGCDRYIELKHWNRAYKRGILCPECQRGRSLESAVRSTSKARKAAETELYRLAARRFKMRLPKTRDSNRDSETEIVEFLNAQIRRTDGLKSVYPRGITQKWLSRSKNRDGINESAKGKTDAKSKRT